MFVPGTGTKQDAMKCLQLGARLCASRSFCCKKLHELLEIEGVLVQILNTA